MLGEPAPNLLAKDWQGVLIWPAAPDRLTDQMKPAVQAKYVRSLLQLSAPLADKVCHAFRASGAQGASMAGCDIAAITAAGRWSGGPNDVAQNAYIGTVVPSVGLALADQPLTQKDFIVHRAYLPLSDMDIDQSVIFPWIEEQEAAVKQVCAVKHAAGIPKAAPHIQSPPR